MVQDNGLTPEHLDKIRKKVQHLLNLTVERGATEAEAATALDKAQALLEKYNLSMDTIEGTASWEQILVEEEFMDGTCYWQRILIGCIARHNMCDVLRVGPGGQKIQIFGRAINVMAAKQMFAWILPQIFTFYNEAVGDNIFLRGNARWRNDFYLGIATRIYHRLEELQKARHDVNNVCKAIVLVRSDEASNFMHMLHPDTVTDKGRARKVTVGYAVGKEAGNKISLGANKVIEDNNSAKGELHA